MKTVTSKQLAWSVFPELPAASPGIHGLPHGVCLGSAHTRTCPISIIQEIIPIHHNRISKSVDNKRKKRL